MNLPIAYIWNHELWRNFNVKVYCFQMKTKIMKKSILFSIFSYFLSACIPSFAQHPLTEWKFYLAFEDATGARDTVWYGMDENITSFIPSENGQFGVVPFTIPEDTFSVYTAYSSNEWTKVVVINIEFPSDFYIYASNYVYPITLSWDTSLFYAPILMETVAGPICNPRIDNDFFFNTHFPIGMYSMTLTNEVEMPYFDWGSEDHFPLWFAAGRGYCDPFVSTNNIEFNTLHLHPNPTNHTLSLQVQDSFERIEIYGLDGRRLMEHAIQRSIENTTILDVSELPVGIYIVSAINGSGVMVGTGKFVKM